MKNRMVKGEGRKVRQETNSDVVNKNMLLAHKA